MMSAYYEREELYSSELFLKYGIEDGSIVLNGREISGNTYRARLAIKNFFKALWNPEKKVWTIREDIDFAKNIFANGLVVSR